MYRIELLYIAFNEPIPHFTEVICSYSKVKVFALSASPRLVPLLYRFHISVGTKNFIHYQLCSYCSCSDVILNLLQLFRSIMFYTSLESTHISLLCQREEKQYHWAYHQLFILLHNGKRKLYFFAKHDILVNTEKLKSRFRYLNVTKFLALKAALISSISYVLLHSQCQISCFAIVRKIISC